MEKLFIDKTIEIEAPIRKVWDVLVKREFTDVWTNEFSPDMIVESDWELGDPVLWKQLDGKVVVEGNVTKAEPPKFLRYTVFDVEMGRMTVGEDDGITFELTENDGKTKLHVLHGDFAAMPEGQKYYDMTMDAWNKILPKMKELAEKN
ncbi:MAG TPA: SRPBCC domain-containing protein [Patescibacteria group bacterium]